MIKRIESWQNSAKKLRNAKPMIHNSIQYTEDMLFIGAAFGEDIPTNTVIEK